jgi:autotransporter-associated beta strand protein
MACVGTSVQFGTGGGTLTLQTSAKLTGTAVGGGGTATLILQGTGSAENDFTRFTTLRMTGTDWTLAGLTEANSAFVNNGTLTITGTLSGRTATVDPGATLQIGTGGTTGDVTGAITDNGSVVFNRSDTVTYGQSITGTGTLTQQGSGTLILNADNPYCGGTTIANGTLAVGNADHSSAALSGGGTVDVARGATLGGFGIIVGDVVNAGTVAPGSAAFPFTGTFGTVTVKGNYVGNGGEMRFNVVLNTDSGPNDMLVLNGGQASGSTTVRVVNQGGTGGATTGNGIELIEATNGGTTTTGAFSLGETVEASAFQYLLSRRQPLSSPANCHGGARHLPRRILDGPHDWYIDSVLQGSFCSGSSTATTGIRANWRLCIRRVPGSRLSHPALRKHLGGSNCRRRQSTSTWRSTASTTPPPLSISARTMPSRYGSAPACRTRSRCPAAPRCSLMPS